MSIFKSFQEVKNYLLQNQKTWVVTGVAGFVGSNLLEFLLLANQKVIGLDNFSTGSNKNLVDIELSVNKDQWKNFTFLEGDILSFETCLRVCKNADFVLHQAALGSVPRSIENPIRSHESNVTGFINILTASRDMNIKKFVYAASSSTYGDHPDLPKIESRIGKPLSPYAVTKLVDELYAGVYADIYNFNSIGLRYFNVFGPRQTINSPYAAVIPVWMGAIQSNQDIFINGDGETSRDFTYIQNVIQANVLAALSDGLDDTHFVFNVAVGDRTSLNSLYQYIAEEVNKIDPSINVGKPKYKDFRSGDVRHSQADINKAKKLLGYEPSHTVKKGIKETVCWYMNNINDQ
jgi:UDP-N-acetylglucosamine 4-epimerase